MPCVVVAGRRGLKGREWMPEGKRYTATAQDGVEAIGQCTKNSHQEGGKEHGRKDNCHVHRAMFWLTFGIEEEPHYKHKI